MTARDTLLLVDSSNNSRVSLRNIFEDTFNILEARNCEQAMLLLEQDRGCIAAVLLDAPLLEANEYKMLCDMDRKHLLSAVPVMVIVDSDSSESEIRQQTSSHGHSPPPWCVAGWRTSSLCITTNGI